MSKSILVIDAPNNCSECRLKSDDAGKTVCGMLFDMKEIIEEKGLPNKFRYMHRIIDNNETKKPDWCPLMDLPNKMAEENRWYSKEYAEGFNACIDEILKGDDTE